MKIFEPKTHYNNQAEGLDPAAKIDDNPTVETPELGDTMRLIVDKWGNWSVLSDEYPPYKNSKIFEVQVVAQKTLKYVIE